MKPIRAIALHSVLGKVGLCSFCFIPLCLILPDEAVALPTVPHCRVEAVNFEGWSGQSVSNDWVKLTVVPQLGGRLMQVEFAGHPYLFVNSNLKGEYFPPVDRAANAKWFNYGGDKLWPLPEGRNDDQHWPGPISDVLDDGSYKFTTISETPDCTVRMEGPPDAKTGLQYTREITLRSDSPKILFHAVMKNASQHPIRWSVQSVTQYDTADPHHSATFRKNFWAFVPVNANSSYFNKYYVRSGLNDDPSFTVRDGLFALHWLNLQNEVWLDSQDGWLAVVDGDSDFAMIERFHFDSSAEYPGKASVIFYKNGPAVEMNEDGNPFFNIQNKENSLRYMEAEINSPMVGLAPGESYTMETEWCPTRAGIDLKSVNSLAVFDNPVHVQQVSSDISLSGEFGVFSPGNLFAIFQDTAGKQVGQITVRSVDPREKVVLSDRVKTPAQASSVVLVLKNADGSQGKLARQFNLAGERTN